MNILGIIPARGGSKGVPRKNIRPLAGKPVLQYTVEAAQQSRLITRLAVSTEDSEIGELATRLGCDLIVRPDHLAGDKVPMYPVIQHALAEAESRYGLSFDGVFILQPTTPLRTHGDIDGAIDCFRESGAESVIGVVRIYDQHPVRIKRIVDGCLQPFCLPEEEGSRRQDLEPAYLRNGAVYIVRKDVLARDTVRGDDQRAYEMPAERSVNIDEPIDFVFAEAMLTHLASASEKDPS